MMLNLNIAEEDEVSEKIRKKLVSFGLHGIKVGEAQSGPIVTGYPIEITGAIDIKRILAMEENLALSLNVESLYMQRIKGRVVVFVPNDEKKIVDFHSYLYWYLQNEEIQQMQLPICLGMDFNGNNSALDLIRQPHILIAGSTGAGKSVFESAIVACLSMTKSVEELSFVLVDTKRVDLSRFEKLSHTKAVVKDLDMWYLHINALIREVDIRNSVFESKGVRNIIEYNLAFPDDKFGYIILVIDEFADLMQRHKEKAALYGKEYGEIAPDLSLARLTQIARAAGIHVILCTQRSSVKIIHGDLKANFPTRIALKLPSQIDSRTILDEKGAENLLGNGDMLVRMQDSDELKRFHAPFVRLEDIDIILNQREMILDSINRLRLGA
jgi:DNA segregation ATPase FtsK/SpoIIIE, S-DNA-T family